MDKIYKAYFLISRILEGSTQFTDYFANAQAVINSVLTVFDPISILLPETVSFIERPTISDASTPNKFIINFKLEVVTKKKDKEIVLGTLPVKVIATPSFTEIMDIKLILGGDPLEKKKILYHEGEIFTAILSAIVASILFYEVCLEENKDV